MVFVTGDCHGDFRKLKTSLFPEQKEMTKSDIVIICGDFGGVWDKSESRCEKYWLDWLDHKPFTTVFADGNHENFDRLNSEYEVISFHGGKAHRIRESVFHLMRGEVFDFEGKRFFVFGGASSHDIDDGIISPDDYKSEAEFKKTVKQWAKSFKMFRIEHISWWKEELPSEEDLCTARKNLEFADYSVDYVITHCAPQSLLSEMFLFPPEPDVLTEFFDELKDRLTFNKWFFGHYHGDAEINGHFTLLYDCIERII